MKMATKEPKGGSGSMSRCDGKGFGSDFRNGVCSGCADLAIRVSEAREGELKTAGYRPGFA